MPDRPPAKEPAKTRRWELDALRGLMLVLMTLTHLPTRFSDPFGQPFGFVSAAEGFVMLSAYMAGTVYTGKALKDGEPVMQEAFFKRALKIYACQLALLLFLFTVVAAVGVLSRQDAVTNLMSYYLENPGTAFVTGLLLVYSPPLLDILPMYILLMLVSPLLLLHGLHRGWLGIMALSVGLWLAAQFGASHALYNGLVAVTGLKLIPYQQLSAFELMAWQFLWVLGLWMGCTRAAQPDAPATRFPPWLVRTAIVVGVVGFVWRHAVGQVPFPGQELPNMLFDKWHLGPMRVINFFALLVLAMHFGPWLKEKLPRIRQLETMGSASLPVFCAHLMLALMALATFGQPSPERPIWIDVVILGASFAALYAVAWGSQWIDRYTAAMRKSMKAWRDARPVFTQLAAAKAAARAARATAAAAARRRTLSGRRFAARLVPRFGSKPAAAPRAGSQAAPGGPQSPSATPRSPRH